MPFSPFLVRGILCLAALAGIVSAQSIAILPGPQGAATTVPIYSADPFGPQTTISGLPQGAFQILPKPDATKYYVISNSAGAGITVLNQSFGNPRQIATAITAVPTSAALSPDGRKLVVIAGNSVYLIDTTTDSILNIGGYAIQGTAIDLAFSHDSRFAFVLSLSSSTGIVMPVDLSFLSLGTKLNIPVSGTVTGITTGPNGLLYVSATNALIEVDPRTVARTSNSTIQVNATPGRVSFTSDGRYAVAVNTTPQTGAAVIFDVVARSANVASGANLGGATLDRILIASDQRIFAYASGNHTLFELSLAGGIIQSPLRNAIATNAVDSFAVSNDIPARSLFISAESGAGTILYKVDLTTNALVTQYPISADAGHIIQWSGVNPTSGATSFRAFNTKQTVAASGTSLPLVVRVQDSLGRPVFGATVTFQAPAGVTLSAGSASTNWQGYAQVSATMGATPGLVTVQATLPGVVTPVSFDLTVPGDTGGPCVSGCTASNVKIISGSGQFVSEQNIAHDLLVAEVDDANGNPAGNQQVTFSITQGSGTIACTTVGDTFPNMPTGTCTRNDTTGAITAVTDATGRVGVKYLATSIFGQSWAQTVVTATSGAGTVNFIVTTILFNRPAGGGQASPPIAYVVKPEPDATGYRIIRGAAGSTLPGAIQIQVVAADGPQIGQPIPNIALNVSGIGDPTTTPSARCTAAIVLTDPTGVATCDLVLGNVITSSPAALSVNAGGATQLPLITIVVTQGPPSKIQILQGNNQSGRAGQQFLLRAKVTDAGGNASSNVPVTWQVTQGSGSLSGSSTQTNAQGEVQTTITLGGSPGNVLVKLTAGTGTGAPTATFTLTVNVTIGGVSAISGGGQVAVTGQAFANPLVVQVVDNNQQPVQGVNVTFSVTSGSASIGTPTVTTDVNGRASVNVVAGGTVGPITITAAAGNSSTQFTLTARQPGPNVGTASFYNAAGGSAGLTPCGIAIVSGAGLATGVQGTVQANPFVGPLPYSLAGVTIDINNFPAPIFWVSNTQQGGEAVAFQTPCELTPGTAQAVVRVGGGSTTVNGLVVSKYQPGIFETVASDGKRYGVVLHADGSYVTPSNPAQRGEQLKLFTTGLGPVTPATATNRAGIGEQYATGLVTVGLNNAGVPVIQTEYLEGAIGIWVITFEVPQDTQTGPYQNLGLIVSDPADPNTPGVYANGSFIPIS
jgi:uncharacterized protein (TIGR03437 family)